MNWLISLGQVMKKIKILKYAIILSVLFFAYNTNFINAFSTTAVCQAPGIEFSNGDISFDVTFPPGGGTTCLTTGECPKIKVPAGSTIYSLKVRLRLTDPSAEIKTPYIWVPIYVTSNELFYENKIKQIDTRDCSVIETYNVVDGPDRTHVIPGGATWVASWAGQSRVSKLVPLRGTGVAGEDCGNNVCGTDEDMYFCPGDCYGNICGPAGNQDCRKYEVLAGDFQTAPDNVALGIRGLAGDIERNVWTGNCADGTISKLDGQSWPTSELYTRFVGGCPGGLVGDSFGHIWIVNRDSSVFNLQCVNISDGSLTNVYKFNPATDLSYGIGIDFDDNVYLSCFECGTVLKFPAQTGPCPGALAPSVTYDTQVKNGPGGVAVDQKGYVWTANYFDSELYVFTGPTDWFNVYPGGTDLYGTAIDFDGNGWVISYDDEVAYKYEFDDTSYSFNKICETVNLGGKPVAYSDMTGLTRTTKIISIPGMSDITIPLDGVISVCSDGTTTCSNAAPCAALTAAMSGCTPDAKGDCEFELEIYSMQAGNYTLDNLEIVYGKQIPVTTGGLMPCGRDWDDPATTWTDSDPCTLCHLIILASEIINFLMGLVAVVALLALIIGGLLYVKTAGDAGLITVAKQNINKIFSGFVIIFIAWLIVNVIMVLFGFTDPLGDASWQVFSCNL